jgi:hypothetical protein
LLVPTFITFVNETTVEITRYTEIEEYKRKMPHTTPLSRFWSYSRGTDAASTADDALVADTAAIAQELENKSIAVRQIEWGYPTPGNFSTCYNIIETGTSSGTSVPVISPAEDGFPLATFIGVYFMIEQGRQDEVYEADWGTDNWPQICLAFQGRMFFFGSPKNPDKIWASRVNNPTVFTYVPYYNINQVAPDIIETDHFIFTASGLKGAKVHTASVLGRGIVLGTTNGVFVVGSKTTALSPFDFHVDTMNTIPIGSLQCITTDSYVLMSSLDRKSLILVVPDQSRYTHSAKDLSTLIGTFDSPVKDWTFNPVKSMAYIALENNEIYSLTLKMQTNTVALNKLSIPNLPEYNVAPYDYRWEMSSVAHWKEGKDIWFLVKKTFTGLTLVDVDTYTYLANSENYLGSIGMQAPNPFTPERIANNGLPDYGRVMYYKMQYAQFPYASSLDFRQSSPDSLPEIYRDQEVYYAMYKDDDGTPAADFLLVSHGKTTISNSGKLAPSFDGIEYDHILIGFANEFMIATMPVEAGAQWGTAQLGLKRIDKISVWYYNTTEFSVSSDGSNWDTYFVGDPVTGDAATGRKEIAFPASSEYDQRVYIKSDGIELCHITSLSMRGVSNDG